MKILCTTSTLGLGGSERCLSSLASRFAFRGHDLSYVTMSGTDTDKIVIDPSVSRLCVNKSSESRSTVAAITVNRSRILALRDAFASVAPDVIVSFGDTHNVLTILACRRLGIPTVVSERTDPRHHRIPLEWRFLRRWAYPAADLVVVQTQAVARWARSFVSQEKLLVIPNAVTPIQSEAALDRELVVVGLGRLSKEKGFDLLIRAFLPIVKLFPDWRLEIYGDGPERAFLQDLIGETPQISLMGGTTEPESLLVRASIFVLPSRYEGFPNALLEAMACGAAVISARCPSGPDEIITSEDDGLLVESENVEEMSTAIQRLIADPQLRRDLGQRAKLSSKRFDPVVIDNEWEQALQRVVTSR